MGETTGPATATSDSASSSKPTRSRSLRNRPTRETTHELVLSRPKPSLHRNPGTSRTLRRPSPNGRASWLLSASVHSRRRPGLSGLADAAGLGSRAGLLADASFAWPPPVASTDGTGDRWAEVAFESSARSHASSRRRECPRRVGCTTRATVPSAGRVENRDECRGHGRRGRSGDSADHRL